MSASSTTQPPAMAKKLPFKPTALRRSASKFDAHANKDRDRDKDKEGDVDGDGDGDGDGLDLFRRSKEMEPIMQAERERRLRKKQREEDERRRAAATAGKRPSGAGPRDGDSASHSHEPPSAIRGTPPPTANHCKCGGKGSELATPPASKRARLSLTPKNSASFASTESEPFSGASPSSQIASATTHQIAKHQAGIDPTSLASGPIVLSDSDDDDDDEFGSAPTPTPRRVVDDEVDILGSSFAAIDEDDEFAEYVRKAEEQRRRQAMSEASQSSATANESIHILVTSAIPNSKPCRVKFLYNQPLRKVKDTWYMLEKQRGNLAEVSSNDEIVLTWRRKKVYAPCTLLNLGIRPGENGHAVIDGTSFKRFSDNPNQVHLETWTADLFQEMEREEELRRKRDAGEISEDDESSGANAQDAPALDTKLRVILKARGLEDVKLTVRPETTVETLMTGFRARQPTSCNKDVGIWFDGDRLEEHMTMDEAEIDDMDTLEVHMK